MSNSSQTQITNPNILLCQIQNKQGQKVHRSRERYREREREREREQQVINQIEIDTHLFVKLNKQIKLGRFRQK